MTSRGPHAGRPRPRTSGGATVGTHRTTATRRPQQQQKGPVPFACNRCHKGIARDGEAWWIKCNCVFCVECFNKHFGSNNYCCSCGYKGLKESDVAKLTLERKGPAESKKKNPPEVVQSLMDASLPNLSYEGLCRQIMSRHDESKSAMSFVLSQLTRGVRFYKGKSMHFHAQCRQFGQQIQTLKAQLQQLEQQHMHDSAENQRIHNDLLSKLAEKEEILHKFRSDHQQRTVSSSGSRDGRRRSTPMGIMAPSRGIAAAATASQQYVDNMSFSSEQQSPSFNQGLNLVPPGLGSSTGYSERSQSQSGYGSRSEHQHTNKRRRTMQGNGHTHQSAVFRTGGAFNGYQPHQPNF